MNQSMRLFIAVNFEEETKNHIYKTIGELKKNSVKGSFTQKENLHLTLVFIGETNKVEQVKSAMKETVENFKIPRFFMIMEGIGSFKRRDGDILWIGIKKEPILNQINKALVQELSKCFPQIEVGDFIPHLTLARRAHVPANFDMLQFGQNLEPINIDVNRISLMKSERIGGKLVYTNIYSCKLM